MIEPGTSPLLPAAATTILPPATAASTACEMASSPSDGRSEPRLSEITSTAGRAAHHWMPCTSSESSPLPVLSMTLTAESAASGATPFIVSGIEPGPTPSPTATDATNVPCPLSSYGFGLPLTRSSHPIGAFESSCSCPRSTPLSGMQICVPAPVTPNAAWAPVTPKSLLAASSNACTATFGSTRMMPAWCAIALICPSVRCATNPSIRLNVVETCPRPTARRALPMSERSEKVTTTSCRVGPFPRASF